MPLLAACCKLHWRSIITAENRQQAEYRANKEQKDVGGRAARACLDMLALKQQLEPSLEGFHSE
jgi:hypothetical protein